MAEEEMQTECNIFGELSNMNVVQIMKIDTTILRASTTDDNAAKYVQLVCSTTRITSRSRLTQILTR